MTVLAAIDFSEHSHNALHSAARFARQRGEALVVVHSVVSADENAFWRHLVETPWEVPSRIRKTAEARLRETVREVLATDETPENIEYIVELKSAADGILESARAHDASVIVMGATGSGRVKNVLLGSTAEHVIRASRVPVLAVAPQMSDRPISKILVPVDFSDNSRVSLQHAIDVAAEHDASLVVLHAFSLPAAGLALLDMQAPPQTVDAYEEQKWSEFDAFVDDFDFGEVDYSLLLRISSPEPAIESAADEEDVDLICMGTRGRRGFKRFFLGSTTARVLRHMPRTVLTVPGPHAD